ncbi:MAG: nucleoside monophosphate kinase [Candidatus Pacebacteria bacterium]|nr:nucleoside monophosphate kinase [Candidatus Paceibacterota bacterium]
MTSEKSETFVFFGIVGSGKGTQVKLLQDFLKKKDGRDIVYAYPGNEYRKIIESSTETAALVRATIDAGHLQPDFLTNSIFTHFLINDISHEKHLIADGYPRTLNQSECLEQTLKFYNRGDVKIIYIEISHDEAMKRNLARGRSDDTKEGIEKRFDEYMTKVVPSMNYFKGKTGYTIYEINGEQSVEDVHKDIIKALGY